ncbi:hypothetical protein [Hyphomicrobium sp.]|uniref:hypothetical protein n=1 Tax=Hyphomicrobium sp. TaxID=82 RepID=UPI000FAB20AE|nr:hypothetical protein [Hyphomicrobium sp.]RUP11048.1 MAG: hypothetical protein EKK38_00900 [Hyphomicrobium sp.]
MLKNSPFPTIAVGLFAVLAMAFAGAPNAFAVKKMIVGPVAFEVPDDFKVAADGAPVIQQDASGITVKVGELPPQALHEFKGQAFLDFLGSLKYTNATYAPGALKRLGPYTYVLADAKGPRGPESRFLLILGGEGRAAIVTAYAPKSEFENGHASRAAIEAILSSAAMAPAGAGKEP